MVSVVARVWLWWLLCRLSRSRKCNGTTLQRHPSQTPVTDLNRQMRARGCYCWSCYQTTFWQREAGTAQHRQGLSPGPAHLAVRLLLSRPGTLIGAMPLKGLFSTTHPVSILAVSCLVCTALSAVTGYQGLVHAVLVAGAAGPP